MMLRRIGAVILALAISVTLLIPVVFGEDGTTVHVRIEGTSATLFSGSVTASDCTITDDTGVQHEKSGVAICAVAKAAEEAGLETVFKDFGFGLFLQKIGPHDTPSDFSQSWVFWLNDDPASAGLDAQPMTTGDRILLAFSAYPGTPLRVTLPDTARVGEEAMFHVEKRTGSFDASFVWHGQWQAATGATLHIGDVTAPVPESGDVSIEPTEAGTINVYATGDNFIRSERTNLSVQAAEPTSTPSPSPSPSPTPLASPSPSQTPTPTPTPTSSPSPSPAITISQETRLAHADAALSYLRSHQGSTGEIDGAIVSGWSAVAFGTRENRLENVSNGSATLADGIAHAGLSSATDIERQILAVRAGGGDPRSFRGIDLVAQLRGKFSGNQIGDAGLVNDDIFGVLAFFAAGESAGANEVRGTVETILSRQSPDGSWENLDMTAAAIQALRAYQNAGGSVPVNDAVSRARSYLKYHQDSYGGFGDNSATTAWVIQAIHALGEDPQTWQANGGQPITALLRYRQSDNGFGWKFGDASSSFMTAYAVPALVGVSWPITILEVKTSSVSVPSPTPLPSPSPRIAGGTIAAVTKPIQSSTGTQSTTSFGNSSLSSDQPKSSPSPSPIPSPAILGTSISPTEHSSLPLVPVGPIDHQFALSLFGAANIGVGISLASIARKARGLKGTMRAWYEGEQS